MLRLKEVVMMSYKQILRQKLPTLALVLCFLIIISFLSNLGR